MDTVTAYLCFLLIVVFVNFIFIRKKPKVPPPGPKGYPFIGSTFHVDTSNLHLTLTKWAKEYGSIYQVSLFGNNMIILNSSDIVREAFTSEPNATIMADRIPNVLAGDFTYGCVDIAFGTFSEKWKKRRKIGHQILKAYGEGLQAIEKSVHEQLEIAKTNIQNLNGNLFDPEEVINEFLSGIIAILLTGRRHKNNSDCIKTIVQFDSNLNKLLSPETMFLLDWFPFLRYVPSKISRLYSTCKQYQKKLEDQIKLENNIVGSDGMVHSLYREMEKNSENPNGDQWLTEDSILAILVDMISGGILTSKGTLWSAINILLHRQDVQKKLQNEVDQIVGSGRQPCLSDKINMPYTEAFIIETLRFISHVPLLLPHRVSTDTKLAGYDIQKGSTVLANVWNIHFNESAFPEPYEFKPERFLDGDGNLLPANSPQRRNFLLFGVGKRSCIGESFARNRMFLFISTMLQNFSFLADDNSANTKFDPREMEPSIVRMPKRFMCRAKYRN